MIVENYCMIYLFDENMAKKLFDTKKHDCCLSLMKRNVENLTHFTFTISDAVIYLLLIMRGFINGCVYRKMKILNIYTPVENLIISI